MDFHSKFFIMIVMKNSRKSLWNILNDNLINIFNLAVIVILVLFIIVQSPIFIIPLLLTLCSSIFNLYLDYGNYFKNKINRSTVHILSSGLQMEKPFNKLVKGDEVFVYPNDLVEFVGKVQKGIVFVNESKISGKTSPVRKVPGEYVRIGSYIISGTAVLQVVDFEGKKAKHVGYQRTFVSSCLRRLNLALSALALAIIILSIIVSSSRGFLSIDNNLQASLLMVPGLLNVLLAIFLFVDAKKLKDKKIEVLDNTALTELEDIDVVCLNKTGTLTTGQYEVFKIVPVVSASFSSNPNSVNTSFAQIVSDVIKTNSERGGWFNALNESFHYDVAKIVVDSCSLRDNGVYSAVSFKGGKTHAIGVPENFEFTNQESIYNSINQYRSMGYRVLVLVESKNPLKAGLIDGKCLGIGVIVLQEKVRSSMVELIKYLQEKGKTIKVISGDDKECVTDICRKAGIDVANKVISLDTMTFEQLEMVVDTQNVFTDASLSQKEFIINQIKKDGHKVLYIGDGDVDTNALKKADLAMSLNTSSDTANKCSQVIVDESFNDFDSLYAASKKQKNNVLTTMALFYSQAIFVAFFSLIFSIANIFDINLVNPFTFLHLITWLLFGSFIPGIVIMLNKQAPNKKNHFIISLILCSATYIIPVGTIYLFQILQLNSLGFFNIPSDLNDLHEPLSSSQVANNLSCLAVLLVSLFVLYRQLSPLNNKRAVIFILLILVPVIYFVLLGFNVDGVSVVTNIDSSILTVGHYFTGGIVAFISGSLFLIVSSVIDIVKGEYSDVKN